MTKVYKPFDGYMMAIDVDEVDKREFANPKVKSIDYWRVSSVEDTHETYYVLTGVFDDGSYIEFHCDTLEKANTMLIMCASVDCGLNKEP